MTANTGAERAHAQAVIGRATTELYYRQPTGPQLEEMVAAFLAGDSLPGWKGRVLDLAHELSSILGGAL